MPGADSVVAENVKPEQLWKDIFNAAEFGITIDGKRPTYEELTGRFMGDIPCLYVNILRADKKNPLLQQTGCNTFAQQKKGSRASKDKSTKSASIECVLMDVLEASGWTYAELNSAMGKNTGGQHRLEKMEICEKCKSEGCVCKAAASDVCQTCATGCPCPKVVVPPTAPIVDDEAWPRMWSDKLLAALKSAANWPSLMPTVQHGQTNDSLVLWLIALSSTPSQRESMDDESQYLAMQRDIARRLKAEVVDLLEKCGMNGQSMDHIRAEEFITRMTQEFISRQFLDLRRPRRGEETVPEERCAEIARRAYGARYSGPVARNGDDDDEGGTADKLDAFLRTLACSLLPSCFPIGNAQYATTVGSLGKAVCGNCKIMGCPCLPRTNKTVSMRPLLVHLVHALASLNIRTIFTETVSVKHFENCRFTGTPPSQADINKAVESMIKPEHVWKNDGAIWKGEGQIALTGAHAALIGSSLALMASSTFLGDCDSERGRFSYLITTYDDAFEPLSSDMAKTQVSEALSNLILEPLSKLHKILDAALRGDDSVLFSEMSEGDRASNLWRMIFPEISQQVVNMVRYAARFTVKEKRLIVQKFLTFRPAPITQLQVPAVFVDPPLGQANKEYASWAEQHYTLTELKSRISKLPLKKPDSVEVGDEIIIYWDPPTTSEEMRQTPWLKSSSFYSATKIVPDQGDVGRMHIDHGEDSDSSIDLEGFDNIEKKQLIEEERDPGESVHKDELFDCDGIIAPSLKVTNSLCGTGLIAKVTEANMLSDGIAAIPLAVNFNKGRVHVNLQVYDKHPRESIRLLKKICPRKVFYELDEDKIEDSKAKLQQDLPFCDACGSCLSAAQKRIFDGPAALTGIVAKVERTSPGIEMMTQQKSKKAALKALQKGVDEVTKAVTAIKDDILSW